MFEPSATIDVGWFHAFHPGVIFTVCGPSGVLKVSTDNSVEFKGAESVSLIFHFHGGSEVMYFLVMFKHVVHQVRNIVKDSRHIYFTIDMNSFCRLLHVWHPE